MARAAKVTERIIRAPYEHLREQGLPEEVTRMRASSTRAPDGCRLGTGCSGNGRPPDGGPEHRRPGRLVEQQEPDKVPPCWPCAPDVLPATAWDNSPAITRLPRYYAAIVRPEKAGAHAGDGAPAYLERGQALRHKVGLALIYPAIVILVACLVVGVLLTYVVPQVVAVFDQSRQSLPWLTRALIAVSDFARETWWIGLLLLLAGGFIARHLLTIEAMRLKWHRSCFACRSSAACAAVWRAPVSRPLAVLAGGGCPSSAPGPCRRGHTTRSFARPRRRRRRVRKTEASAGH
jgi:hypothetical protein